MSNVNKNIKSSIVKNSKKRLVIQYGKTQGMDIYESAISYLKEMLEVHVKDNKYLRIHTHKNILPGVAVYVALKELVPQDEAMKFMEDTVKYEAGRVSNKIKRVLKIPGLYKLIPALFLKMSLKLFGERAGFQYTNISKDKSGMCLDMVKCPYFETCKKWACSELTHVYCDSDDYAYGNMHKKLIWGRSKTLGKGGDCCDFKLTIAGR